MITQILKTITQIKVCVISCMIALVIAGFGAEAAMAEETPFIGEINAREVNLRSDATVTSKVIATLSKGARVEVILENYGWYKIRLPKDVPAYVKKSLTNCIKYTDTALAPSPSIKQCLSAKIAKERVNIRAQPSQDSPIVGIADANEVVNVIAETGSWYKIEPIQNSFGWVNKKFIAKAPLEAAQSKVMIPQDSPENLALFTGRVQPYGVVFFRPATHKLITQDNQVFLLKGNRASLNALNRQKVKVTGKLISGLKSKYPVIEVKIIEVAN